MDADLQFLGLLNRGGRIRFGEDVLHSHRPALLLIATDASENSKKKYLDYATSRGIRTYMGHTKAELGSALGYEVISCILIEDQKAAKAYLAKANPQH